MPVTFRIHPSARLVEYAVEGNATAEEAGQFLDAVAAHPDYRRGFNFLGDRRGVDHAPGTRYVQAIADEINRRCREVGPCRWAVVVSGDLADGMARMWAELTGFSGVKIMAFRTVEAAVEWLGLAFAAPAPTPAAAETVDLHLPPGAVPELPVVDHHSPAVLRCGHCGRVATASRAELVGYARSGLPACCGEVADLYIQAELPEPGDTRVVALPLELTAFEQNAAVVPVPTRQKPG